jgi:hypothetical protein
MNCVEYTLRLNLLEAIHALNLQVLNYQCHPESSGDEIQKQFTEMGRQIKGLEVMKAKLQVEKLELELKKFTTVEKKSHT